MMIDSYIHNATLTKDETTLGMTKNYSTTVVIYLGTVDYIT